MLPVLYEDNHLLVVDKPAGLPTMGVAKGRSSVLSLARDYIKHKYQKTGNVYLGIVSRLDAPVTGALLIARTSKAASRLSAAFRSRDVNKLYLALVAGHPDPSSATLEHYLRKDERHRKMHTTSANASGAQLARLHYELQDEIDDASLLRVTLLTGRKHQIRVQLAKQGHPIWGDRKYGSDVRFPQGIALHARELQFQHPVQNRPLHVTCPTPKYWPIAVDP